MSEQAHTVILTEKEMRRVRSAIETAIGRDLRINNGKRYEELDQLQDKFYPKTDDGLDNTGE